MQISILIGQVPVTWDVDANLETLRDVVDQAQSGDVIVLPEGMLSGYGEDLTPLEAVDRALIDNAVAQVAALAVQRQVHIFCGSLLPWQGGWCNAGLIFTAPATTTYTGRSISP
ncbi:nitrilase-related carbon-nitrogen hydrolase [Actinoplanes sp. NPDC051411]|uniref:nitrilase-related carbon-nitrogen hydrolase n=1 Tax=Actinoplanes sp. NPDC051411 TaxID=3155522 RepID=UPI00342C2731